MISIFFLEIGPPLLRENINQISIIVILYGIWNLVYYIKYVKNKVRQTPMGDIIGITAECFEPISSTSDDITYEEDYGSPVFE